MIRLLPRKPETGLNVFMVQDIKPDNIPLDLDNTGGKRVVQAKLADCGM